VGHTLLAIDDSPDVHRLLDVRLKPESLAIHHAFDAGQGLAMARQIKPDLILLDVDLPEVTGFQLCRQLKGDESLAHVPVIFLTGASQVHDIVEGFDLGAVDYVLKPFEPAELRARVRAALRTKRYHDLLAARSQIDGLTGIWNRAHFNQRLGEGASVSPRPRCSRRAP
jgi:PleD family two-component response regulator